MKIRREKPGDINATHAGAVCREAGHNQTGRMDDKVL